MPTITVRGMHCKNCQNAVQKAIAAIPGVSSVEVNLEAATATWEDANPTAPADKETIRSAVEAIGFDAE